MHSQVRLGEMEMTLWSPRSDQPLAHLWFYSPHHIFMEHSCVAATLNLECADVFHALNWFCIFQPVQSLTFAK